jgi:hypothetical protein
MASRGSVPRRADENAAQTQPKIRQAPTPSVSTQVKLNGIAPAGQGVADPGKYKELLQDIVVLPAQLATRRAARRRRGPVAPSRRDVLRERLDGRTDGRECGMVLTWKIVASSDATYRHGLEYTQCCQCGRTIEGDGTMQRSFTNAKYVSKVPQTADDFLAQSETEAESRQAARVLLLTRKIQKNCSGSSY